MTLYTWDDRELPILRAIHGLEESTSTAIRQAQLCEASGLDSDPFQRGLKALHEGGYVTGRKLNPSQYSDYRLYHLEGIGLTEKARQAIGQWPSDSMTRLIEVLSARISETADPDARSSLEKLRDALTGAGAAAALEVIKAWSVAVLGPDRFLR